MAGVASAIKFTAFLYAPDEVDPSEAAELVRLMLTYGDRHQSGAFYGEQVVSVEDVPGEEDT